MKDTLKKMDEVDRREVTAAIERFARKHDKGVFGPNQKKYTELIPKNTPGKNQQYAFEVDLDKCTGCKACVTACHSENGLDVDETWRSVGVLHGGSMENPALQHVTSACHHCADPACMNGCPTLAYKKDEATGIVQHLDDQCFGCQYCILKCPYDVPKYNKKRGIVHKCDMCIGRLTDGQAPACVRACPTGAIRITIVDQNDVEKNFKEYVNVPDSPASNYTYPTTKYKSNRIFPTNMTSGDYYQIKPEHAHLPLVFMLVLTQLSVGAFCLDLILRQWMNPVNKQLIDSAHIPMSLGIGLLALASSILHLGRPHLAFRAILGFKTSWLSREIIAFAGFAKLAILYALCHWFEPVHRIVSMLMLGAEPLNVLPILVIAFGLMGVICSVMVYRDTRRPFWDTHVTTYKFLGTGIVLGAAVGLLSLALGNMQMSTGEVISLEIVEILCRLLMVSVTIKMLIEASIFMPADPNNLTFIQKTAVLMKQQLRKPTLWRYGTGIFGGIILPSLYLYSGVLESVSMSMVFSVLIMLFVLAGELLERYLFFTAVVPLKMPGSVQ